MNVRVSVPDIHCDSPRMLIHEELAMTANIRVTEIILSADNLPFIETREGLRIQVIQDYSQLPQCQKHQFAAFVNNPGVLVVWEDDPQRTVERVQKLEKEIMAVIWRVDVEELTEKKESTAEAEKLEDEDPEAARKSNPRRLLLNQTCITALTLAIAFAALGAGHQQVAVEIVVDRMFIRLAFLALFIPQMWLALVRW